MHTARVFLFRGDKMPIELAALNLPCKHDPPRFFPDEPFVVGRDCNVCYLAYNDPKYNLRYGGDGNVGAAADPSKPKVTVTKIPWNGGGTVVSNALRIGDHAEKALSTLGITKERVEKWLGRPCHCTERQEKLNRFGAWVAGVLGGKAETEAKEELDKMIG